MDPKDYKINDTDLERIVSELSQDVTWDEESQFDPYEVDHDENNELYDYETRGQELFDNEMYQDDTEELF